MDLTYEQLIKDMSACEQTKGMSVLEHGQLVNQYYHDLIDHLKLSTELKFQWRVPDWIYTHKDLILKSLYDDKIMDRYHIHHDCGKPYCRTVDDAGKHHFPDHCDASYKVWSHLFPEETLIGNLIKSDMDIHIMKGEDVAEFATRPEAISLILTGLSEVHANASMFGGLDSTSFKIKWKQINKRGRQVLEQIK